jgi:hypothetical protein
MRVSTAAQQASFSRDYEAATVIVRRDIVDAHRATWDLIARPGSWWTGAERVAIAAEVRHAEGCTLCVARKAALSPSSVSGEHESLAELPDAAIDAIHRIVTDPGRLSQNWFEGLVADGLSDASYVELVSVVVATMSVDYFARSVGVELLPLPLPVAGACSGYRPACAQDNGAWVPTIAPGQENGAESNLYGGKRPAVVATALSLVPEALRIPQLLARVQYISPGRMMNLREGRSITRAQMELVAARVSAINECFY